MKRVQFIRHLETPANAFIGLDGEITVDTTNKALRVHDGVTPGGTPVARTDLATSPVATVTTAGKMSAAQALIVSNAWTSTNDGTGSGLDADLFDGLDSLQFVRSDADDTISGNNTYSGISTFTGNVVQSGANIKHQFYETDAALNEGKWLLSFNAGIMGLYTQSDDEISSDTALNVYRTGYVVDQLDLSATLLTHNGTTIWDSGNDGSGSGLDADLFDGLDSSVYARTDVDETFAGDIAVSGTLRAWTIPHIDVGAQTSISEFAGLNGAATLYSNAYYDGINMRYVQNGYAVGVDLNPTTGAFTVFTAPSGLAGNNATISPVFSVSNTGLATINANTVWHAGNDGSGSGLDADLFDGLDSLQFARTDLAEEVFAGAISAVDYLAGGYAMRIRRDSTDVAGVLQFTNYAVSAQLGAIYADSINDMHFDASQTGANVYISAGTGGNIYLNTYLARHNGNQLSGSVLNTGAWLNNPMGLAAITKVGTGTYHINTGVSATYTGSASLLAGVGYIAIGNYATPLTYISVQTFDSAGVAADKDFSFIVNVG